MSNNYSCELSQNDKGLYDLTIKDGPVVIVSVRNVMYERAIVLIEDNFHTKRRAEE